MIPFVNTDWSSGFNFGFGSAAYTRLGLSGGPQAPYTIPWPNVVEAALGGVYNAIAYFPTGSNVSITLYDPVTGAVIPLANATCEEIDTTGVFVWDSSKLVTQPGDYQEYAWVMTDGVTSVGGGLTIPLDSLTEYIINKTIWG